MNIFQRLSLGAQLVFGRLPDRKQAGMLRPSWEYSTPTYAIQGNFERMVEEGYYRNELIYACINKTAASASQISLAVRKKKDRSLVPDHPLLDLIHTPNEEMNESDLWGSAVIYQKLCGRALYEKERNRRGEVVRLLPLRPDWVRINPGKTVRIESYTYAVPGSDGVTLRAADVLDIKLFDPRLKTAKSPLHVLARAADVDNAITDFIKLFFENGGAPQGVFMSESEVGEEDWKIYLQRWREKFGGYRNWTIPGLMSGEGIKYQQLGLSFKDMGFEVLDERDEAHICAVMGVPPIIVGARVGLREATYSNYAQARKAWWEDELSPMYVNYLDVVGRLMAEMDRSGEFYVDWDFSNVKAFQEEVNQKWTRATSALAAGGITRNQFFAEVGLPGGGPKDDVYLIPLNIVETPIGVLKKPTQTGTSGAAGTSAGDGKLAYKVGRPADEATRIQLEAKMRMEMEKYFSREFGKIKEGLRA